MMKMTEVNTEVTEKLDPNSDIRPKFLSEKINPVSDNTKPKSHYETSNKKSMAGLQQLIRSFFKCIPVFLSKRKSF